MWKCNMCGSIFSEPERKEICYESEYGVSSMFSDSHYGEYDVCPYCGSENIDSYWEDEDDEIEE